MNAAEIIMAIGWIGCALMAGGALALLVKLLIVDPLRWRRRDREDLARLTPKSGGSETGTLKAVGK